MALQDVEQVLIKAQAMLMQQLPAQGQVQTAVAGMSFGRCDKVGSLGSCVSDSFISFLVQGSKETVLSGSGTFNYHAGQCLISALSSPSSGSTMSCTVTNPMLYVSLNLNFSIIDDILRQDPSLRRMPAGAYSDTIMGSACVIDADYNLATAFLKLIELNQKPERIGILSPLFLTEIHYYALLSRARPLIVEYASGGGLRHQIARAAAYLKDNYCKPVFVEDVAALVNMAPSTFFRHFKDLVGVTPMQYLKQIRLHNARTMLLHDEDSVSAVAYKVGYESPSQFSRDYKRLFGLSPTSSQGGIGISRSF
ncbi:MAG: AraC family transcriptional regulator [Proteobacteria bacterium]|uniref:AraC family transcriptional regulator n=1 Tax=Candidatus Avisuccinivibrio stercorigallinarum TaxID=2840704 RepID=A0A9D9GST1_9GAMM|nr:AraC family transcriptional regulator [Candidatus Avisuccinivibrio stercorigallinarum]